MTQLPQAPKGPGEEQTFPTRTRGLPVGGSANSSSSPPGLVPQRTIIPSTDAVVIRYPLSIGFLDTGTAPADGDIITIRLNGKVVASNVLLTAVNKNFNFKLNPGINKVTVTVISGAGYPWNQHQIR